MNKSEYSTKHNPVKINIHDVNNNQFPDINNKKNILKRPETPCIDIVAIRNNSEVNSGKIKNFTNLFKQIIENKNKNFLEGNVNIIEYIISKYCTIPIKDVKNIMKLNLVINSDYGLLNQFGEKLPFLRELKLSGSKIPSIIDLGSNFKNLRVLNLDNCNLSDLTGLVCLNNLVELSAKNNKLSDLFEIESLSNNLKYLQLENNEIEDIENILFLSSLNELEILVLKQNPISRHEDYKKNIIKYIPWLKELDIEYKQKLHYDNEFDSEKMLTKKLDSSSLSINTRNNSTVKLKEINLKNKISYDKDKMLMPINAKNNLLTSNDTFSTYITNNNNSSESSKNNTLYSFNSNKFNDARFDNNNNNNNNTEICKNLDVQYSQSTNLESKSNDKGIIYNNFYTGSESNNSINKVQYLSPLINNKDNTFRLNITNDGTILNVPNKLNPIKHKLDNKQYDNDYNKTNFIPEQKKVSSINANMLKNIKNNN